MNDDLSPITLLEENLRVIADYRREALNRLERAEKECAEAECKIRAEKLELQRLDERYVETRAAIERLGGSS